ncbi:hypothetical protein AB5N19_12468 [Seiridium cardinale]
MSTKSENGSSRTTESTLSDRTTQNNMRETMSFELDDLSSYSVNPMINITYIEDHGIVDGAYSETRQLISRQQSQDNTSTRTPSQNPHPDQQCDSASTTRRTNMCTPALESYVTAESEKSAPSNGHNVREKPKAVASIKKSKALMLFTMFHLPALSVTLALLGLYTGKAAWPLPGPSANVLNAIQFAAKMHEALIIASITDIVFHRLRYGLLGDRGVPLGYLAAPFQISSIYFFLTKEFWGPITSARQIHHILTALLLLLSMVLASTSGPSSAILMIPRLGWSAMSDSILGSKSGAGTIILPDIYLGTSLRGLYSTNITGPNTILEVCTAWFGTLGNYPVECPTSGWRDLIASLTEIFLNDRGWDAAANDANFTVASLTGSRFISAGTLQLSNRTTNNSVAYATSPSDFLASALNWKSNQILDQDPSLLFRIAPGQPRHINFTSWMQPVTLVYCAPNSNDNMDSDINFAFADGPHAPFNISFPSSVLLDKLEHGLSGNRTTQTVFLKERESIPFPISAITLFAGLDGTRPYYQSMEICLTEASWAASDVELLRNGTATPIPQSTIDLDVHQILQGGLEQRQVIRLGNDWIESLNQIVPVIGGLDDTSNVDFFTYIASFCSRVTLGQICRSVFLSSFLADALSRFQLIYPNVYYSSAANGTSFGFRALHSPEYNQHSNALTIGALNETHLKDHRIYLDIPLNLSEQMYGYRFDNITIIIAMSILLLHVTLVVFHTIVGILGRTWSSNAWSGLGELLALALQSDRIKELPNTGAGASEAATWIMITKVREIKAENRLQLVLSDGTDNSKQDDMEEEVVGIPKPDWKYS